MRGALHVATHTDGLRRIIPADAGSTVLTDMPAAVNADHPRGCGEHWIMSSDLLADPGSSPRMRGAHDGKREIVTIPRIIPADAGSTLISVSLSLLM